MVSLKKIVINGDLIMIVSQLCIVICVIFSLYLILICHVDCFKKNL